MTILKQHSFEGDGPDATAIATGGTGSGDGFDVVSTDANVTLTAATAFASRGTLSMKAKTTASTCIGYAAWTGDLTAPFYVSLKLRRSASPTVTFYPMHVQAAAGQMCRLKWNSDGTLSLYDASNALIWTSTGTVTDGTFFRVEVKWVPGSGSVSGHQVKVWFSDAESSTAADEDSGSLTGASDTNAQSFRFGVTTNNNSGTTYFDDVILADAPIGNPYVGGSTESNPLPAAATGTANDPTQTVTTHGGQAAATGTANDPNLAVTMAAGYAAATGTAYDAAPTSAVPVLAMAQVALAVGVAYFDAGLSESIVLTADNPIDGSGQAYDAIGNGGTDPMTGGSTGTAYDAMVVISQGATADPLAAAAAGTAYRASVVTIERRYILRIPTSREGRRVTARSTPAQRGLYRHFATVGEPPAVLVTGDVVEEVYDPTFAQVAAADYAFMGGHENVVPPELVSLLQAAGYTVELTT